MYKFTVTRQPRDRGAPESVMCEWTHHDPHTAQERAISHAQRLARADADLTAPPMYRVITEDGTEVYRSKYEFGKKTK